MVLSTKYLGIRDVKLKISTLVKSMRKKHALTQAELAKQLDVSRLTIQKLEAGKNFTIETLLKIFLHFDMLPILDKWLQEQINDQEQIDSLY